MIRVMVVDDDKLVRKGLISAMPWEQFGMTVVGEANNGENALKFMEENQVDLLVTDLAMPVMSGIELMREVRRRYPHIQIVVLTLHQDFEYVQEALRLGALDYIAKIELESEQFEEVLGRIAALLRQKTAAETPLPRPDELGQADEVYALYALTSPDGGTGTDHADFAVPEQAVEAEAGVWVWARVPPDERLPGPDGALVLFRNVKGMDRKALLRLIRDYRRTGLFYDYDPSRPHWTVRRDAAAPEGDGAGTAEDIDRIRERWVSFEWIYDDGRFAAMTDELRRIRLAPARLARMFFSLADEWNRLYRPILPELIVIDDFFPSWCHFEAWLGGTREAIRQTNARPMYSPEIQQSIVKAMNLAHQMLNQPLTAGDIAQMVNMSSSYFSQCFKNIVGRTYTDYVRAIRMERAKRYLAHTTKTVQWIAEQVGYSDEKYFSRLFREEVGMLPSEYRQAAAVDGSE